LFHALTAYFLRPDATPFFSSHEQEEEDFEPPPQQDDKAVYPLWFAPRPRMIKEKRDVNRIMTFASSPSHSLTSADGKRDSSFNKGDKEFQYSPDRYNKEFDLISPQYGDIAEVNEWRVNTRSRGKSSQEDSPSKSGINESNG
jgi:hypothetical protein